MYKKILIPMALDHGLSPNTLGIARTLLADGGEMIGLHVYEAPQGSARAYLDDALIEEGYQHAKDALKAKLADAPGVVPTLVKGHSARTIVDFAAANGVDCIVLGSHKPGLSDFFLGSTASFVVRHAGCAVHVHREG